MYIHIIYTYVRLNILTLVSYLKELFCCLNVMTFNLLDEIVSYFVTSKLPNLGRQTALLLQGTFKLKNHLDLKRCCSLQQKRSPESLLKDLYG